MDFSLIKPSSATWSFVVEFFMGNLLIHNSFLTWVFTYQRENLLGFKFNLTIEGDVLIHLFLLSSFFHTNLSFLSCAFRVSVSPRNHGHPCRMCCPLINGGPGGCVQRIRMRQRVLVLYLMLEVCT